MKQMAKVRNLFALLLVVSFVFGVVNLAIAKDDQKININTATVEELIKLKGVGSEIAKRIVRYREENGLFKAPEDIMEVKGIGEKIFEKNKDLITVE
jgi:competence protein ComEA